MTRLAWGAAGSRNFEAGVDRGVLYVGVAAGVPWNGLISVNENPSGGEAEPYYMDGIKYLNLSAAEEYEASISAFSAPDEFGPCDGSFMMAAGLFITQQPRKPFDFTYRTLVGDELTGIDLGYKLHLVYSALAKPASRANKTIDQNTTPLPLEWSISTLPELATGFKPSAHFVIDTRKVTSTRITNLENILYGTVATIPRMPTVPELITVLTT